MDKPWVYIVLLGLLFIVYARLLPRPQAGGKAGDKGVLSEMEETMEHFAAELEEQNQALIQMFADTKKDYELHSAKLFARVEQLERQNDQLQQHVGKLSLEQQQAAARLLDSQKAFLNQAAALQPEAAARTEAPTPAAEMPESLPKPVSLMNVKERYGDLFQLYDQGKSTDFIARKLGMNKGEINLILQLAKREAQSNV